MNCKCTTIRFPLANHFIDLVMILIQYRVVEGELIPHINLIIPKVIPTKLVLDMASKRTKFVAQGLLFVDRSGILRARVL